MMLNIHVELYNDNDLSLLTDRVLGTTHPHTILRIIGQCKTGSYGPVFVLSDNPENICILVDGQQVAIPNSVEWYRYQVITAYMIIPSPLGFLRMHWKEYDYLETRTLH